MTPEARVKQAVKALLKRYAVYAHWPVPSGYGDSTIDCLGCIGGAFFGIETKAPGKKPTPLQDQAIQRMRRAHGEVFVIDNVKSPELGRLEDFLKFHSYAPVKSVLVTSGAAA